MKSYQTHPPLFFFPPEGARTLFVPSKTDGTNDGSRLVPFLYLGLVAILIGQALLMGCTCCKTLRAFGNGIAIPHETKTNTSTAKQV